ncbi:acyl-CoA dehydrogenase family protein [Nesterenkonia sp. K-15-9-6]|uniref:acyl-CoA dehydrogenase family protein n=1 Tax=Nesterenkonia sp. K-15-9-6 TaxID=3093918 RepID=UPI00404395B3
MLVGASGRCGSGHWPPKARSGGPQDSGYSACLQLHGGYGYILEYSVAQAHLAVGLMTIFGSPEVLRETVASDLLG